MTAPVPSPAVPKKRPDLTDDGVAAMEREVPRSPGVGGQQADAPAADPTAIDEASSVLEQESQADPEPPQADPERPPPFDHSPIVITDDDIARSAEALTELRQARRHNHRETVHWVDTLYKAYMTGLGSVGAVVVGSTWFPNEHLDADAQAHFLEVGPRMLGLVIAVAVAIGLRSGARGGPLAIEAASVHYELQAPVPRRVSLRTPVLHHLRFATFAGVVVGGVAGTLAAHRFATNGVLIAACCALGFALSSLLANAIAIAACGRRMGTVVANLLALAVLAWSAADVWFEVSTSPATGLAGVSFLPLGFTPLVLVGLATVPLALLAAVTGLEHLSVDRARERAGLVAQLRFAATMQDVRTVVLLRRQLSHEKPRSRPWINLGRGPVKPSRLLPTWRRDWQSYLRFPLVRLLRMVSLSIVAGVAMGFTWRGAYPAFLLAGAALFLAAYDTVEPVAQEVDHPTRWNGLAGDEGKILLSHLPAALVVMILLVGVAGASSLLFIPADVVARLLPPMLLSIAGGAVTGATLSTVMGTATGNSMMPSTGADSMGMDTMGMMMVIRMLVPPAITVGAILPLMAAGTDPNALNTIRVSNLSSWPLFAIFAALLFVRYRKPSKV